MWIKTITKNKVFKVACLWLGLLLYPIASASTMFHDDSQYYSTLKGDIALLASLNKHSSIKPKSFRVYVSDSLKYKIDNKIINYLARKNDFYFSKFYYFVDNRLYIKPNTFVATRNIKSNKKVIENSQDIIISETITTVSTDKEILNSYATQNQKLNNKIINSDLEKDKEKKLATVQKSLLANAKETSSFDINTITGIVKSIFSSSKNKVSVPNISQSSKDEIKVPFAKDVKDIKPKSQTVAASDIDSITVNKIDIARIAEPTVISGVTSSLQNSTSIFSNNNLGRKFDYKSVETFTNKESSTKKSNLDFAIVLPYILLVFVMLATYFVYKLLIKLRRPANITITGFAPKTLEEPGFVPQFSLMIKRVLDKPINAIKFVLVKAPVILTKSAFSLLSRQFSKLINIKSGIFTFIRTKFISVIAIFKGLLFKVAAALKCNFITKPKNIVSVIVNKLIKNFNKVLLFIISVKNVIKLVLVSVFVRLPINVFNGVVNIATSLANTIRIGIKAVLTYIVNAFLGVIAFVKNIVTTIVSIPVDFAKITYAIFLNITKTICITVISIPRRVFSFLSSIIKTAINKLAYYVVSKPKQIIISVYMKVTIAILSVVTMIVKLIKSTINILKMVLVITPKILITNVLSAFINIILGVKLGVSSGCKYIINKLKKIITNTYKKAITVMLTISSKIATIIRFGIRGLTITFITIPKSILTKVIFGIINTISGIVYSISSEFTKIIRAIKEFFNSIKANNLVDTKTIAASTKSSNTSASQINSKITDKLTKLSNSAASSYFDKVKEKIDVKAKNNQDLDVSKIGDTVKQYNTDFKEAQDLTSSALEELVKNDDRILLEKQTRYSKSIEESAKQNNIASKLQSIINGSINDLHLGFSKDNKENNTEDKTLKEDTYNKESASYANPILINKGQNNKIEQQNIYSSANDSDFVPELNKSDIKETNLEKPLTDFDELINQYLEGTKSLDSLLGKNLAAKPTTKVNVSNPVETTFTDQFVAPSKKSTNSEAELKFKLAEDYISLGYNEEAFNLLKDVVLIATGELKLRAEYLLAKSSND